MVFSHLGLGLKKSLFSIRDTEVKQNVLVYLAHLKLLRLPRILVWHKQVHFGSSEINAVTSETWAQSINRTFSTPKTRPYKGTQVTCILSPGANLEKFKEITWCKQEQLVVLIDFFLVQASLLLPRKQLLWQRACLYTHINWITWRNYMFALILYFEFTRTLGIRPSENPRLLSLLSNIFQRT